jgi:hypothetical protein
VLQNEPWFVIIGLLGVKFYGLEYIGELTHDRWRMGMQTYQWHFIGQWRGFIGQITHWQTERNNTLNSHLPRWGLRNCTSSLRAVKFSMLCCCHSDQYLIMASGQVDPEEGDKEKEDTISITP